MEQSWLCSRWTPGHLPLACFSSFLTDFSSSFSIEAPYWAPFSFLPILSPLVKWIAPRAMHPCSPPLSPDCQSQIINCLFQRLFQTGCPTGFSDSEYLTSRILSPHGYLPLTVERTAHLAHNLSITPDSSLILLPHGPSRTN